MGEVAAYALAADGDGIDITVIINTPYERYVTAETRFWGASGIDLTLSGLDRTLAPGAGPGAGIYLGPGRGG